ncbi:hypothetical protein CERSUDRAFT_89622 [Gelatoporia subvermispora B]|uniref:Uncharacterized protein n=1 Tax=Ceriporiopsis subvermispora (strain B) TaxID=914234 RepID=M2Q2A9_CERS8|nr:hypothetical protein CERSUDRAFT_89622 [Gelatoporia subvermispora B]
MPASSKPRIHGSSVPRVNSKITDFLRKVPKKTWLEQERIRSIANAELQAEVWEREKRNQKIKMAKKRRANRERQRKHRKLKRDREIARGERTDDGRKIKVRRLESFEDVSACDLAESSRPRRNFRETLRQWKQSTLVPD